MYKKDKEKDQKTLGQELENQLLTHLKQKNKNNIAKIVKNI
jgi:hypothetical protein